MDDPEAQEVRRLLEGVRARYGYDFCDYAEASIRRRVVSRLEPEGVPDVSRLAERVLRDPECFERLLLALAVHSTSMFRDPGFFRVLRDQVVALLGTWPHARIWDAGCSTGEELHSLAIVLEEEGLLDRCRIYATDLDEKVLRGARRGVIPLADMRTNTANYLEAGGKRDFSSYYSAQEDHVVLDPRLRRSVIFAPHNLVSDGSFNEFHLILCRNVMIYFNRALQDRVHRLIFASLARLGVLALGRCESLRFTPHEADYEMMSEAERVYRKVRE